jgi:hypothetical protein
VADGAHHLLRDKEDAAADDGADDDGGGLREAEDALKWLVFALCGGGDVSGYGGAPMEGFVPRVARLRAFAGKFRRYCFTPFISRPPW